ncbi:hypothetical protein [Ascidiimonas aurantiaca]|uniref:hypothetical protein n=1 Tax=Ascidiimonas aurantiaca TaxID=1685432 RepID=UPI0030EF912E
MSIMKNEENYFDEQIKALVKEAGLDKPSENFARNVMLNLERVEMETVTYKPLISAPVWWMIAGAFAILVGSSFFAEGSQFLSKYISWPSLSLPRLDFTIFGEYSLSGWISYSIILTLVLVLLQMYLFKSRFDRSLDVYQK